MKMTIGLALAAIFAACAATSHAAIIYNTPGATYSENFDSLPNTPENTSLQATKPWTDDTTLTPTVTSVPGWYLYHPITQAEGGANGHQRFRILTGSQNTGSFYSFGSTGSTERALGVIGSTTLAPNPPTGGAGTPIFLALRVTNSTAQTLVDFTVGYHGEKWRQGSNTAAESITVAYTNAATTTTANWFDPTNVDFLPINTLTWASPNTGTNDAAVDGNNAGRGPNMSETITGLNWLPGTDLWIRFSELQVTGNDDGLSIDDVSFSARGVPEPGSLVLLGIGLIAVASRRQRRVG